MKGSLGLVGISCSLAWNLCSIDCFKHRYSTDCCPMRREPRSNDTGCGADRGFVMRDQLGRNSLDLDIMIFFGVTVAIWSGHLYCGSSPRSCPGSSGSGPCRPCMIIISCLQSVLMPAPKSNCLAELQVAAIANKPCHRINHVDHEQRCCHKGRTAPPPALDMARMSWANSGSCLSPIVY